MRGRLRIESWDRTLKDALFTTAGGQTFKNSVRAAPNSNTVVDVDTATGIASLYRADMSVTNTQLTDLGIDGEQASFAAARLPVKAIALVARDGQVAVSVTDATGTAASGKIGSDPLSATLAATRLSWQRADAGATVSQETVKLKRWSFTELTAQSDDARVTLSGGQILSGKSRWKFAKLGSAQIRGDVDFTAPSAPQLEFAVPAGSLPSARISLDGPAQALVVKGALTANQLNIGGAQFGALVPLGFERRPGDSLIRIPLAVHIGDVTGTFGIKDEKQEYVLKAALKRFDLSGDLVIDLANIPASRMEIPQKQLGFDLATSVSVKPFAAGVKPSLAQVGVKGENSEALVVRKSVSTGKIEVATPTLILANPILAIGEKGNEAPVEIRLEASGSGAVFGYNLADSKISLIEGDFAVGNTRIYSPDPNFVADFGGTLVERPDFQLENLSIRLKRDETIGKVAGGRVTLSTGKIRSAAGAGDGATYSGQLSSPFTITSIDGGVDFSGDKVGLIDLSLRNVSLALNNAKFNFGKGMGLSDVSLRISADQVRSISRQRPETEPANGTYVSNLRIRADGKLRMGGQVHLAIAPTIENLDVTLNGNTERLNGSGSASVSPFAGTIDTSINTSFECENGSQLMLPLSATLAVAGGNFDLSAKDGEYTAKGSFAPTLVNVRSTATKSCRSKHLNYNLPAKWAKTRGWCPTWRKPRRTCTWKTKISPEINIGYRIKANIILLHATLAMTNPRLLIEGQKTSFCNVGAVNLIAPTIIAGYTPQLDNNGIIVKAINAAVEVAVVATESSIANGVLGNLTFVVNNPYINTLGSSLCIMRGSYEL